MTFKERVLNSKDPHQEVLDIAYSHWQEPDNDWTYADMILNTESLYGELAAIAVLVGKYNQQVCNGGHMQYFDNGYASANSVTSGCMEDHQDKNLHDKMVDYLKENGFKDDAAVKVMDSFYLGSEVCGSCQGDGVFYEEEECLETGDIDEIEEECYDCDGSGEDEYTKAGEGDDNTYYMINDEWMERFQKFLVDKLSE